MTDTTPHPETHPNRTREVVTTTRGIFIGVLLSVTLIWVSVTTGAVSVNV